MRGGAAVTAGALGAGVGLLLLRWRRLTRWQVVTIDRPPGEVTATGRLPGPLGALGDRVEVALCPTTDGRGSRLAARPRSGEPDAFLDAVSWLTGDDPRAALRWALRRTKQVVEAAADRTTGAHRPDR